MLNREIFHQDPAKNPIANDGVAEVGDLDSLRFELQTFVCEGEYETAINGILDSYLSNLGRATQPAVWLSGFFGSGKSHVAKMLAALWTDQPFPDGARPRGLAQLPQETLDRLKELSRYEKTHGPLHVAMGKLLGRDAHAAVAVLGIILESRGLPTKPCTRPRPTSGSRRMTCWTRSKPLSRRRAGRSTTSGRTCSSTGTSARRSPGTTPASAARARRCSRPCRPSSPASTRWTPTQFRTLAGWALGHDESCRLTAVILDEVQQYLGDDNDKIAAMQWVVELLSKDFAGRVIVIATGQSNMTMELFGGKLTDRFTQKFVLKETDVQRVVRRVVLDKASSAEPAIRSITDDCSGEINRHLAATRIGPRPMTRNTSSPITPCSRLGSASGPPSSGPQTPPRPRAASAACSAWSTAR